MEPLSVKDRDKRMAYLTEAYGEAVFVCAHCRHKAHEVPKEGFYCFELDTLVQNNQKACLFYSNKDGISLEGIEAAKKSFEGYIERGW